MYSPQLTMKNTVYLKYVIFVSIMIGCIGCQTIANYDQTSYQNLTNTKVDALALLDKANGSYSDHTKDITAFNVELDKAYEYDKGRPLNTITLEIWDKQKANIQGCLDDWKSKGTLNTTTITDYKNQVGAGFDKMIHLESGKNKASQTSS